MPLQSMGVTGTYQRFTGGAVEDDGSYQPVAGKIRFVPSVEVIYNYSRILAPQPIVATLDSDGHFAVDLICTDDPALRPDDWFYTVTELFPGGRTFELHVPVAYAGFIYGIGQLLDLQGAFA